MNKFLKVTGVLVLAAFLSTGCAKKKEDNTGTLLALALLAGGASSTCNYSLSSGGTTINYTSNLTTASTTSQAVSMGSTAGSVFSATIHATLTVGQSVVISSTTTSLSSLSGATVIGIYRGNTCPLGSITVNLGLTEPGLVPVAASSSARSLTYTAVTAGTYTIVLSSTPTPAVAPTDITVRIQ